MSGDNSFALSVLARDSAVHTPYHYIPTEYVAIIFVALFSISTLAHIGQTVHFKTWWMLPTAGLCGVLEVLGWGARLWSSISPSAKLPFTIQMTATILGPTPLVAANFIILGKIIERLGPSYSRLSPKLYSIIFCSCDLISLTVQGVGGGVASSASNHNKDPSTGGNIMLGGIIFQMVTITLYVFLAAEFYFRFLTDDPFEEKVMKSLDATPGLTRGKMDKGLKMMSAALCFNTVCLFIRAIYRTIELTDGWHGRIISTEVYFNVLDGAMITLAIFTVNFAHPGLLLGKDRPISVRRRNMSSV
ncbi:RTA1-domain-containing protein [Crucibulum laeve]|uniref:RTA1-domain-containing protein n=1 Tax=Crucibulum laeve TaxID=68775 RepID=A0A5C3LQY1_9AGAR|nr:RTA1-domain-containing protein [Crucibulum laeve]